MTTLPTNMFIKIIVTAMLKRIPSVLIVPDTAEATPKFLSETELIMAFVFGEENIPKPIPKIKRGTTIQIKGVLAVTKAKGTSPAQVSPIPTDTTIRGSILSDNQPLSGDKAACITG